MTQITWRNVNGPSLSDTVRPLEVAQRMFSDGFSQLRGIAMDQEAINANNAVVQRNNNTNSYLDQLTTLGQSPEALQEAMKNGAIARLRAGFGNNIDADKVRGAAEGLLAQRMQQVGQANQYADQQLDRSQLAERDQIASWLNSGDKNLIAQGKARLEQVQLRNEAPLYAAFNNASQQVVDRERDTTRFGWDKLKLDDQLANGRSQRAASAAQIAASKVQQEMAKEQRTSLIEDRQLRGQERKLAAEAKLRTEKAGLTDYMLSSEDGIKTIEGSLGRFKNPETQSLAREAVAKMSKIPGITAGIASQALAGMADPGWLNTDHGLISDAVDRAKTILTSSDFKNKQARNEERLALINNDLADLAQFGKKIDRTKGDTKTTTPAKTSADTSNSEERPVAKSPNSVVTEWHKRNNLGNNPNPAEIAATAITNSAVTPSTEASQAQYNLENKEMYDGKRLRYSPEVQIMVDKLKEVNRQKAEDERKKVLAEELKKEARKVREATTSRNLSRFISQ